VPLSKKTRVLFVVASQTISAKRDLIRHYMTGSDT
jgi:hypothetical protein